MNKLQKKLEKAGYKQVSSTSFFELVNKGEPIFAKNVIIGENVYGITRKADYILFHPKKWTSCLVLRCRGQYSPGSVDEKFVFEVASINANKYDTIFVVDGTFFRPESVEWLKSQAGIEKLMQVCDLKTFLDRDI